MARRPGAQAPPAKSDENTRSSCGVAVTEAQDPGTGATSDPVVGHKPLTTRNKCATRYPMTSPIKSPAINGVMIRVYPGM